MIGQRIGPYEVQSKLGEGGMGVVYRATDTHLKRAVAIKVLPAAVAADADRVARFQREAQVLASLSHPNIAAIYGVEKTPELTALVMELVDGEDLSALIARGNPEAEGVRPRLTDGASAAGRGGGTPRGVKIEDALPIAKQIADALEAAHEQGIIHRDLKPANIKVRPDGTVKVLDFGLAKALDRTQDSGLGTPDAANSPTLTNRATQMGMILGTAAYMAPEQARGKVVDRRADIWSFGVVLYEMLSGRRAFEGDDVSVTLANVIKDDVNWDALPGDLPAPVLHLLRRSLEKNPKQRLRDIGEARIQLENASRGVEDAGGRSAPAQTTAVNRPGLRVHLAWAAAVVAAVLLTPFILGIGSDRAGSSMNRLELALPPLTRDLGWPEISPDGRMVAVVAGGDDGVNRLWVRSMDELTFRVLAGTEDANYPFWSPDSRSIAFFANDVLNKVLVSGGPPQPLCAAVRARGGSWGRAGVLLFTARPESVEALYQVPETGGQPAVVAPLQLPKLGLQRFPHFLPDGRRFLFFASARQTETDGVYLGSLDGGSATRLVPGFTQARYSDGRLFFVRSATLMAQPFDPSRPDVTGEAVPVLPSIAEGANEGSKAFSVSADGIVVAVQTGASRNQLRWFDRAGRAIADLGTAADHVNPRISPNGLRVAMASATDGGQPTGGALWLIDTKSGTTKRMTVSDGGFGFPIWSTDETVIFSKATTRDGNTDLYRQPANGGTADEALSLERVHKFPQDISADGRSLIYVALPSQSAWALWVLTLPDGKPQLYLKDAAFARLSPLGGWLAYQGIGAGGRAEVFVRSFPTPDKMFPISNGGGDKPVWSRDGKELFYQAGRKLLAVPVSVTAGAVTVGTPKVLFDLPLGSSTGLTVEYDVSQDGRFLFNVPVERQAPKAVVTLNWKAPEK
jgi:Tol biopolymer transport system component/tRNA A-37 threonylcarbamoyl transferase component Bud32